MTEAEAIKRFESFALLMEALVPSFRPNGYAVIDPVRLPDGSIEEPGIPISQMTYIWREREEWVWESELVVPGPGPRHRFQSLSELVDAVIARYQACRKSKHAEQIAAADRPRE